MCRAEAKKSGQICLVSSSHADDGRNLFPPAQAPKGQHQWNHLGPIVNTALFCICTGRRVPALKNVLGYQGKENVSREASWVFVSLPLFLLQELDG